MSKLSILSLILLLTYSFSSHAAVFKCEENGKISFSDKPCKDSAQDITEKQPKSFPKNPDTSSSSRTEKAKQVHDELQASRTKRKIQQDIRSLKKDISNKKKALESKLKVLEKTKNNVDYGEDYFEELQAEKLRKSISDNITDANNRYAAEISALQNRIKILHQRLAEFEP
ncbi:MAG: hypothetical protein HOB14_07065 [Gammaproteobacteria bacterium]|jgi:phage host-nuclease inhibitor protein Gam|nr:hypothetical protein [Gammaproteobacteria bacterium]MBT4194050.1 hypothetical protein [Gammaproteobacteria bacterium]MBT6457158.1 hypothetical protein [Gammaproteobacteria bacterium]MBT6701405.1 hypothetical protein [Gammaproteobacteria bacterium]MBT7047469.1 hypothetical protein [Gammaproteobacteria bacterium]